MKKPTPPLPPEAQETPRARLRALLLAAPATARELSGAAALTEKDVVFHLEHLARSSAGRGERIIVEPPRCLGCGFVFDTRHRLGKPSRCPECRGTRITAPRFALTAPG